MRYFLFLFLHINACLAIQTSPIEASTSLHDEQQEGLRAEIAHNVTTQRADLLAEVSDVQPRLPSLSPLYLDYRLSGAFADFERFAADIEQHAPAPAYYPMMKSLFQNTLAEGDEGQAGMFEGFNADATDHMMENLSLKKFSLYVLFPAPTEKALQGSSSDA